MCLPSQKYMQMNIYIQMHHLHTYIYTILFVNLAGNMLEPNHAYN